MWTIGATAWGPIPGWWRGGGYSSYASMKQRKMLTAAKTLSPRTFAAKVTSGDLSVYKTHPPLSSPPVYWLPQLDTTDQPLINASSGIRYEHGCLLRTTLLVPHTRKASSCTMSSFLSIIFLLTLRGQFFFKDQDLAEHLAQYWVQDDIPTVFKFK